MGRLLDRRPVLLIEHDSDDEILTRRAIEASLASTPVVVARNASEAEDYLFNRSRGYRLPRLVLLDWHLPGVNALDLLRKLRSDERTRLLPVIVLTNSEEESDIVSSYGFGANSCVRKPVRFEHFSTALSRLAEYWLDVNQAPPELAPD